MPADSQDKCPEKRADYTGMKGWHELEGGVACSIDGEARYLNLDLWQRWELIAALFGFGESGRIVDRTFNPVLFTAQLLP